MKTNIKAIYLLSLSSFIFVACNKQTQTTNNPQPVFSKELRALKAFYHIPGMAVLIRKDNETIYQENFGYADIDKQKEVTEKTLFPIASITKTFSSVLIFKLVEQGKLSLEDAANQYIPQYNLSDSVKVKHLLSHTSQGRIGEEYFYSNRFGLLTEIIEKASDSSFDSLMDELIFKPLALENTFLMKRESDLGDKRNDIARPYFFEGEFTDGFLDEGHSASAGIVTTISELAKFDDALDENLLISEEAKASMFSPYKEDFPYGYGIFSQEFKQQKIVWAHGQYDCYASLFLKVPELNTTLIILANTNLMSDAPRLINGDITTSLFALSFLKNYIFDSQELPLLVKETPSLDSNKDDLQQAILMANVQSRSFMARFDVAHLEESKTLLKHVYDNYTDYTFNNKLNLLHTMSFIRSVHFYRELGAFHNFDNKMIKFAGELLETSPQNPYVHIYLGTFYDRNNDKEKAKNHYEQVVNASNFSENWYTREAKEWLDNIE